MRDITQQVRQIRIGRVFAVTSTLGTAWWERIPRGCRWVADRSGNVTMPEFYPLSSPWADDTSLRTLSMDESARFMAVLALTRKIPGEYI